MTHRDLATTARGAAARVAAIVTALVMAACAGEPQSWAALQRQLSGMNPADRSAAVDAYVARHGGTPLVENQSRLIFLAKDVDGATPRVVGDFNRWGQAPPSGQPPPAAGSATGTMTRIDGTDWSYLEGTAWTNARLEYVLVVDARAGAPAAGASVRPDPLNPRAVESFAGPRSEIRMPFWVSQSEIDGPPAAAAGTVTAESVSSRELGGTRRVWFYLPPGYSAAGGQLYPVVYILDGGNYVEKMDVPRVLDRLIATRTIRPLIAVFSEPADRQDEYSRNPTWRAFMSKELVPLVDKRFRTFPAPDHRIILGSSLSAYGAVDLAVEFPSVFGLCAAIAPPAQASTLITNQAHAKTAVRSSRFFVLGGLYDSLIDGARRLRSSLEGVNAAVVYLEVSEGHSTETFRGHLDDAVKALLPEP